MPDAHLEGIAGAIASLTQEMRAEREATARQIADLAGAIREQGAHIESLAEAQRSQWDLLGKQRERLQNVAVEARAAEREKEAGRGARKVVIESLGVMFLFAGLITGPLVTYVSLRNGELRSALVDKIHDNDKALVQVRDDIRLSTQVAAVDRAWRERAFRVQAQLAAKGVAVDWGEIGHSEQEQR